MIKDKDLVYICSPLSASTRLQIQENMKKAEIYSKIISDHFGCRAVAPHSFLPYYLDDMNPEERKVGLDFGLSLLRISKAIIVCGNRISSGMESEIELAKELKIPGFMLLESKKSFCIVEITQKERILHGMQVCKNNIQQ